MEIVHLALSRKLARSILWSTSRTVSCVSYSPSHIASVVNYERLSMRLSVNE